MRGEFKFNRSKSPQVTRLRFNRSRGGIQKCQVGCQTIVPQLQQIQSPRWKNIDHRKNNLNSKKQPLFLNQNLNFKTNHNCVVQTYKHQIKNVKFIDLHKFKSFPFQRQKSKRLPLQTLKQPRFQRYSMQQSQINTQQKQKQLARLLFGSGSKRESTKEYQHQFLQQKENYLFYIKNQQYLDQSEILLDDYTPLQKKNKNSIKEQIFYKKKGNNQNQQLLRQQKNRRTSQTSSIAYSKYQTLLNSLN